MKKPSVKLGWAPRIIPYARGGLVFGTHASAGTGPLKKQGRSRQASDHPLDERGEVSEAEQDERCRSDGEKTVDIEHVA